MAEFFQAERLRDDRYVFEAYIFRRTRHANHLRIWSRLPDLSHCGISCNHRHPEVGQDQIDKVGAGAEYFYSFQTIPVLTYSQE